MGYLKEKDAPYSYGKEWIISDQMSLFEESRDISRLLVPWSWVLRSENQPISSFDPTWAAGLPKTNETFVESLRLDTHLKVIDKLPLSVFGVVTNNLSAAENLSRRIKERWFFSSQIVKMIDNKSSSYKDERIHIETTLLEVIHPNAYKYQFIFSAHLPKLDRKAFIIGSYTDPFHPPPPLW